jgi:hypothetical protein
MDKRLRGAPGAGRAGAAARLPGDRRRWLAGGAVVVAGAAAVLGWALWPDEVDPRARVYTEATACLLTPADGVSGREAAPVWAGMQEASLATRGKVQFLEVDGPPAREQAVTYLATLAGGGCDLVLTVGKAQNDALTASAASYPKVSFVMIGAGKEQNNVSVIAVDTPDDVRAQVGAKVASALKGADPE